LDGFAPGTLSLSRTRTTVEEGAPRLVPPVGALSARLKTSSPSTSASSVMKTFSVLLDSPAAKRSVPVA
jgi:hypothetical protein